MSLASDFLWNWLPQQIEPKSRLFDTKRTPKRNQRKLTLAAGWCQCMCKRGTAQAGQMQCAREICQEKVFAVQK